MREYNIQKSEMVGHGFKVWASIMGDKVQIVIDDVATLDGRGVTVIDMYHNDIYVRIGTDHIIHDTTRKKSC